MSTEATFMTGEKPIIIGVAGGSGSGKTTVTRSICQRFPDQKILVIEQDYYYKDQGHLSFEERLQTNYDHPLAFDNDLLMDHVQALLKINQWISLFTIIKGTLDPMRRFE